MTISLGIITTIAGSSTSGGYSGDNGHATAATLNSPHGVTLDSSGILYILDISREIIYIDLLLLLSRQLVYCRSTKFSYSQSNGLNGGY